MLPRHKRLLSAASLGALALAASHAAAEPAPPFAELLRQSQAAAPRLAEAQAEIARAEGLARQGRAIPNPTLGLEVENFSGSGPYKGLDLAETTASVEQTIELGGKRSARIGAGRAEVEAARRRAARVQAEFGFDLAEAYAQAEAAERRLLLAREALTLAEDDARVAGALVEAGREAELRRVQARAAVQSARAAVEEAVTARATAFGRLTALAGSPAPLTSIPQSLLARADRAPAMAEPDPLASPAYQAAVAEREAAARRVRVERTRAAPDVTALVGLRSIREADATAMVAGLSVPLPLFDRNRGAISAAQAEQGAAEARLNAARLEAEAEARSATSRLGSAQGRLAAARDGESAAAEAYRLTRIGYEGGKVGLAEVVSARRALVEARSATLQSILERLSAEAALARLQGRAPFGDQP